MSLGDTFTGGEQSDATNEALAGLDAAQRLNAPTAAQLTLPELQQYAVSQNMTPAQMQAFLQQNNAYNTENVGQQGTAAQIAAINQLAGVANAGAAGSPTEQAQIAQALQQSNTNLQGQRGSIDQQAEARGVGPGMLQAALGQVQSGQDQQAANQAALQAQGQNYQAALAAMASGANAGQALQGQQNTQANTVSQAQNAMQQFNAANQQNASANNAGFQQTANATNTQNANQTGAANTGLANQRTLYNANVPQQVYNNSLSKVNALTGAGQVASGASQAAGQQNAGIYSGLIGAGATLLGGPMAGAAASSALSGTDAVNSGAGSTPTGQNANQNMYGLAKGGIIQPYANGGMVGHSQCFHDGGICMVGGGFVPGKPKVAGDSLKNDTVPARLSPGEAVVPRTTVQQNPAMIQQLLAARGNPRPPAPPIPGQGMPMPPGHHPQDVASLLAAMKHMRGA